MTTRLSKIARLPAKVREQLNRRLHNGELGRTILPWVNELPKTKKVLAEIFNGKPITHQNLSEWRATGYQDWLFHQQRLDWFSRLEEEDNEISKHDGCGDTYEAMSRFFLFEIGQAMRDAQKIKNPDARWQRIEPLAEKFARLQNSYNWSRRCQLEYDKYNHQFEPDDQDQPDAGGASVLASRAQIETENEDILEAQEETNEPVAQTFLSAGSRNFPVPCSESAVNSQQAELETTPTSNHDPEPECHAAGALQDAPRTSKTEDSCASPAVAGDCGSPLPLSNSETQPAATTTSDDSQLETENPKPETNSQTPRLVAPPLAPRPSTLTPPNCQPIPTPPPTTPVYPINPRVIEETNSIRKPRNLYTRTRGRGFICVEG